LIDLNMPVRNGYKLCENVVNLINENKIQRFAMVALTGEDRNEVIDICRSTGFNDVIMKPLSLKDLKNLIG
jgi:CheY-like chemotaxis protein